MLIIMKFSIINSGLHEKYTLGFSFCIDLLALSNHPFLLYISINLLTSSTHYFYMMLFNKVATSKIHLKYIHYLL